MDKGEFVVGLDDSFPPMGFRDEDGNLTGFDIEACAGGRRAYGHKSQPSGNRLESKGA